MLNISSGLDIKDAVKPGHVLAVGKDSSIDVGRKAFKLMEKLRASQETFTVIEKVEHVTIHYENIPIQTY